jgi:hypothetical protein
MGPGKPDPKSLEDRYEEVAGDADERRTLYAVRKFLGFSIREWREMTWWERRLYIEELNRDQPWNDGAQKVDTGARTPRTQRDVDGMVEEVRDEAALAPIDSLGMLGFKVRKA